MAGMATYLDVLRAINELPGGAGLPPTLPGPTPLPVNVPTTAPALPSNLAFPTPTPPPAAPSLPLDQNIISQFSGPAPVAPTVQPRGRLGTIADILAGLSSGLQGRAPQFLAGLEERRERPQREFKIEQEKFEGRRQRGVEAATRAEERRQGRSQQEADRNFEIELKERARQLDLRDTVEIEKLRDTLLTKRQRQDDERAAEETRRRESAQQVRDARQFASTYGKAGAPAPIAKQLGDYYAGLTEELSPAAAKWESAQARLANIRANRAASGGVGGGGTNLKAEKALADFEAAKQSVILAESSGRKEEVIEARKRMNTAFGQLARFPAQIESGIGEGNFPYAKPRTGGQTAPAPQQPQAQGGGLSADERQLQQYAQENNISIEEARRDFQRAGIRMR